MKGFGMLEVNKAGWMENERPVAGPLDVICRPLVVAPCSSDVHMLHGFGVHAKNLILGHEAVGEVVEVGSLVRNFKAGDVVVVPAITPDWSTMSVQGKYNAHDVGPLSGFKFAHLKDGVFAELFHVNNADANLAKVPQGMKLESALMTVDMMSTGFHGVELAEIGFGDTVVVMGIGPIGLMSIAGAKLRGAGRIIAIGTRPNCVQIAKEYGATDIVSYKEGDVVKQITELVGGTVDSVIMAGGGPETLGQALTMVKAGGIISNVNFFDAKDVLEIPAHLWGLGMANKDIRGGLCPGGALRMQKMLEVIQHGRIDPSKLLTHHFEGFDKIEDAFLLMEAKPSDLIKPVVKIQW